MSSFKTAYTEGLPYRSVLGLAKDGRPVYTPFYSDLKAYDDCEVDVCNGISLNGHYSYVSTFTHPYIMGCYGPGTADLEISQSCSLNPKTCGADAEKTGAFNMINSAIASLLIVSSMI
jgi:hypothetical protein